jgi:hypothetical protein
MGQAFEIVDNLRPQVESDGSARREERFLTSAGRRFRRSESGRKSRPAPFEMTSEVPTSIYGLLLGPVTMRRAGS